jgi:CMP-N,N'-diacetyllegionaminic acid synthase
MSNLAIIPARSGSKGLKHKNIMQLMGRPLLAYTIEAAIQSNCFDHVFVSTDSQHYADIAMQYGADASFLRSAQHAQDASSTWDAVDEVISHLHEQGKHFDTITLLQPTSPLRNAYDIQQAMAVFVEKKAHFVESVCEVDHSPLWCNTLDDTLSMTNFISREYNVRRQLLPKYYRKNGAIYIFNMTHLHLRTYPYTEGSYAYVMPPERSIDIDTIIDMELANIILKQ